MDSVDFDALEEQARAKMPSASFAFCAAGADDEISAVENITAWRDIRLRPRVLNDVETIDTRVTLLGPRGADADPGGADRTAQIVPRRRRARHRTRRRRGRRGLCDGVLFQRAPRGCRRRAARCAAMVSALLLAEPCRGRSLDRSRRGRRLHRTGSDGRCAGRRLEPARRARTARAVARNSQHQHAGLADGAHRPIIPTSPAKCFVPGDLARTGMAGRSVRPCR